MLTGPPLVLSLPAGSGFGSIPFWLPVAAAGLLAAIFAVLWWRTRHRLAVTLEAIEQALDREVDDRSSASVETDHPPRVQTLLRAIGWRRAHGRLLERGLSGLRAQAVLEAVSLESQRLLEAGGLEVASVTCVRIRPGEGTVESHSRLPDGTRELVILPHAPQESDARSVSTFTVDNLDALPDHLGNLERLLSDDGSVAAIHAYPLLAPASAQTTDRLQGFLAIGCPPSSETGAKAPAASPSSPRGPAPAAPDPPHLAALLRTAGAALATCGRLVESQHVADDALLALARAADSASTYSRGHSERVSRLAVQVARTLGHLPSEIECLRRAALLHDLGVVALSSRLLDQEDAYDEEDRAVMRPHVEHGVDILAPLTSLQDVVPVVAQHHEWWDGGGYPAGLEGEEIHPLARILSVVDVYEALTSSRPYRGAMQPERALRHLEDRAGSQFEPKVVETLAGLVRAHA